MNNDKSIFLDEADEDVRVHLVIIREDVSGSCPAPTILIIIIIFLCVCVCVWFETVPPVPTPLDAVHKYLLLILPALRALEHVSSSPLSRRRECRGVCSL